MPVDYPTSKVAKQTSTQRAHLETTDTRAAIWSNTKMTHIEVKVKVYSLQLYCLKYKGIHHQNALSL